ncbi:MAG: hypothetical protein FWH26_11465, partial [Oscillospiraceae bacterium]|nr:hypothetical protein [Oscillospiraceae bacterium]
MRKSNPFLRAAIVLLAVSFCLSAVVVGTSTYAKYVTQGNGIARARAAKFSFLVGSYKPTG